MVTFKKLKNALMKGYGIVQHPAITVSIKKGNVYKNKNLLYQLERRSKNGHQLWCVQLKSDCVCFSLFAL